MTDVKKFIESYLEESNESIYIDKSDNFFIKRFGNEHSDAWVKEYIEKAISYQYGISKDSAKLKLSNEEFSDDEIKKAILYYDGSDLEGKEHYDNFKWLLNKYGLSEGKLFTEADFHKDKRFQQDWPFISDNATGITARNKRKHSSETLYCIYDPDSNYTYMEFFLNEYGDSVNEFFKKSGDARKECLQYVDEVKSGHGWEVYRNILKDETWKDK